MQRIHTVVGLDVENVMLYLVGNKGKNTEADKNMKWSRKWIKKKRKKNSIQCQTSTGAFVLTKG